MSVLWAVSIGLLSGAAVLVGWWLRVERRREDHGTVRISYSWADEGVDQAGLNRFVGSAKPAEARRARRKNRRSLGYSPPSPVEITSEFPAPS